MKFRLGIIVATGILFGLLVGSSLRAPDRANTGISGQSDAASLERALAPRSPEGTDPLAHLSARAALSLLVDSSGREVVWYEKESHRQVLFASLVKLLTALVVAQHYDLGQKLVISKAAVETPESAGGLVVGESYAVRELLYPLLIESSNDAASALVETVGREQFITLMQSEADRLGMRDTVIQNATGLDAADDRANHTTAIDLARLARAIKETHPELFDILYLAEYDVTTIEGETHHLENTDELLQDPNLPGRIIGGKTGYTPTAKGCLVLLIAGPGQGAYTVNIILGSDDRFRDMRSLVSSVYQNHSEPSNGLSPNESR